MSAHTLPIYFQKTQFTSRIGETEQKQVEAFLQKHFPDGKYPESAREFLQFALNLTGNQTEQLTDYQKNLIEENARLKSENEQLKKELQELQAINDLLKDDSIPKTEIDFSIFEDPRIRNVGDFRLPEHQHPFDTISRFKKLADDSIIQYESLKFKLEEEPFHLLEKEEYAFLKEWDEKVFMPAMRALTGIEDLRLTGRHKFMMMLDYCQADPIGELTKLIPGLTPLQLAAIEDMQFPRESIVEQVLKDIAEKQNEPAHELATIATQMAETNPENTGGKVVALNANGATEQPAQPAEEITNNGDKPE